MKFLKIFGASLLVVILAGILQYFMLLPFTIHSIFSLLFIGMVLIITAGVGLFVAYISDLDSDILNIIVKVISIGIFAVLICLPLILEVFSTPIFRANSYKNLVNIQEGKFSEDIPEALDTDIMDISTAKNIGSRVMGEIDNVSQYVISDEYNMIIYQNKTYRVSPLEYASIYKALGNDGISGYVLVDCHTQEAKLVTLNEKIKYSPSAIFGYNLKRHIRANYPSALLGKEQFEIDDEGAPYYIVPTYRNTIGLFEGKVLDKILVINAINGDIKEYTSETLPEWIEHADSVDHMMSLAKYNYTYVDGFLNSIFSQKNVKDLSYSYSDSSYYGYSSIRTKNGIEYFTGVTSVNNDESNLGFLFLNPRTGKTTFYSCVGAEESSAQSSAEALVQNYGYKASYPFVVNVDGIETYLIALKDKTGTNKAYSFVNVKNYTIATQASTKEEALAMYKKVISKNGTSNSEDKSSKINAKITEVYTAVENSTTYFYYKLEGYEELFVSSILNNRNQVLYKVGDKVTIEAEYTDNYYLVTSITK